MDTIMIVGLRELGVHGVLPEEQTRPQPFEVDVRLTVATAGRSVQEILATRREQQHRNIGGGAQLAQQIKSVHSGKHHIEDDHLMTTLASFLQTSRTVLNAFYFETLFSQILRQHFAEFGVVIDDKDLL